MELMAGAETTPNIWIWYNLRNAREWADQLCPTEQNLAIMTENHDQIVWIPTLLNCAATMIKFEV